MIPLYSRKNISILLNEFIIRLITANYFIIKKIISKELPIRNNIKLLDIGCGTGILSPYFSNADYIGIDIDQKLIDFAKKRYPDRTFLTMGGEHNTLPDSSFDFILVVGVIHHLNNTVASALLKQAQRVLRKNGTVLIIEAIPPIDSFNMFGRFIRSLDKGHFIRPATDYKSLFKKYFSVKHTCQHRGGIVDYAVFVLTK